MRDERAIKRIPKDITRELWINEIQVLKLLRHENIPIVYDMEEDENYIYIIEEYIKGQSLRAYRLNHSNIQETKLLDFILQLCDVLHFLHSRKPSILYLDLKPDNLLITEQEKIKLIDFGTAAIVRENHNMVTRYGTRGYASPEQCRQETVDERSDIYGIGGILYFLVTGHAYDKNSVILRVDLQHSFYSRELILLMEKCLDEDPERRFSSAMQLRDEIKKICELHENDRNSQTPYLITVAGSMNRIGATHISFMFTSYLNLNGYRTLYIEYNQNRVVETLLNSSFVVPGSEMVRGSIADVWKRYPEYDVYVCDCGYVDDNKIAYDGGNKRFLVLGGKPWEQTESVPGSTDIGLVNLSTLEQFIIVKERFHNLKCFRIPYVPDLMQLRRSRQLRKEMEGILSDIPKKRKNKRWF